MPCTMMITTGLTILGLQVGSRRMMLVMRSGQRGNIRPQRKQQDEPEVDQFTCFHHHQSTVVTPCLST